MKARIGIVGVSGYGGGELLRLVASHPEIELAYVAGESSAGSRLGERFPALPAKLSALVIEKFDPVALPQLDLLFASLPTGASAAPLAMVRPEIKIVDIGGDHRYQPGWVYGMADLWPERLRDATRVANPGCFPAASILALAPLLRSNLIAPTDIIIDAKTGVSGAGRGSSDAKFGYSEVNEDLAPYGLLKHTHMPEIVATIGELSGTRGEGLVFTPHLVPMTRGIVATIYCRSNRDVSTGECLEAARATYASSPFVRVTDAPPHSKWATGSNMAFVSYAADPARKLVIAMAAIDNLGKGAAGQALQNANLMLGLPMELGLTGVPVWP